MLRTAHNLRIRILTYLTKEIVGLQLEYLRLAVVVIQESKQDRANKKRIYQTGNKSVQVGVQGFIGKRRLETIWRWVQIRYLGNNKLVQRHDVIIISNDLLYHANELAHSTGIKQADSITLQVPIVEVVVISNRPTAGGEPSVLALSGAAHPFTVIETSSKKG
jgi:hypothetical protein